MSELTHLSYICQTDTNAAAHAGLFLLGLRRATTGPQYSWIRKFFACLSNGINLKQNLQIPNMIYSTEEPHKIKQGETQYLKSAGIYHSGEQDQFKNVGWHL